MARTIANAFGYFVILLAVVAVPVIGLGYLQLSQLGTVPAAIVVFLAGFLIGLVKRQYIQDNISTIIISIGVVGLLSWFIHLGFWANTGIYILGYPAGRKVSDEELGHDLLH